MTNYLANLNERERRMLYIGGVCLSIYLLYALIYSPLVSRVSQGKQQLVEKQATLAWMQEKRQQPLNTGVQRTINSSQLLTVIASQLQNKPFQKFAHQLQQTSQGDVELSFDTVPYTPVLRWFWELENQFAITLKQFEVHSSAKAGLVKLRMVLAAQ